ncbi:MAG: Rne/Rng family ribonuclease, partial [Parachlamydiales bacterium]
MQEILLNIESKERRYALLQFGRLQDLVVERKKSRQITGNIYYGRVTNILHNIQSAFIDIGEGENGFIHISDIIENSKKFEELFDMDFEMERKTGSRSKGGNKAEDITRILKIDQPVLVQVVKEAIGTKGARLTSNISLAGRYLVLLPNTPHRGVSRKIEERSLREKLKKLVRSFELPQDMGLICRTASSHATEEMLISEATALLEEWQKIVEKFHAAKKPALLFEESDLIKRAVITAVDKKLDRILIDHYDTCQYARKVYETFAKEHPLKIEFYRDPLPLFERFGVEKEIDKAVKRKVYLTSGGYLYFDRTEAMFTIDVNSGRSLQSKANRDLEETLVRINLEAAEEMARQLRIRNIGGLIVCDFIDMRLRKNQRRVLEKLKEFMKEDSAKCTILGMSEFGLVEMTRQRSRESLHQTIYSACPYCSGLGAIKSLESSSI